MEMMKLMDKLKRRYPKMQDDPLVDELESLMMEDYEEIPMEEGVEEEMPMDEEMGMEEDMGEEEEFMTDEEESEDEEAIMLAIGKPKKRPIPRRK